MPVCIQVDEAYAFDYLSILEVKFEFKEMAQTESAVRDCLNFLAGQISNFHDIKGSAEYEKLKEINRELFKTIDILKKRDINARVVDELNHQRFLAKKELQEKFFPEKKLRETKIGYAKGVWLGSPLRPRPGDPALGQTDNSALR